MPGWAQPDACARPPEPDMILVPLLGGAQTCMSSQGTVCCFKSCQQNGVPDVGPPRQNPPETSGMASRPLEIPQGVPLPGVCYVGPGPLILPRARSATRQAVLGPHVSHTQSGAVNQGAGRGAEEQCPHQRQQQASPGQDAPTRARSTQQGGCRAPAVSEQWPHLTTPARALT